MSILLMLAQAAAASATVAAAPAEGVISYPPAFFAASSPANAIEMLQRVPGFTLDTGDSVRGYEGAAGNVLIDGQRPATKTDNLEEILRRIQAGQVERVEIIRGGAPGIDMQGKSVLANVVKKQGGGFRGLVAVANNHIYDGRDLYGVRIELSGGSGGRNWEASARYGMGQDDGAGEGPGLRVGPNGQVLQRSFIDGEGDGGDHIYTGAYTTPLAGGTLRLNGRLYWTKFKSEEDKVITFPTASVETLDDVYPRHDTEIGGNYSRNFGTRTALELVALRQTRDQDVISHFVAPGDDERFTLNRMSSESIARAVLKYRQSETLSFEAGGEGAFNKLESRTRFDLNGARIALPSANVVVEETRGEAFAKAVWRPTPRWTLDGGLRYEASHISSEGDTSLEKTLRFAKPRISLTWAPSESTQVRLRYERVVGQLNFDDFVASANFATTGVTAGNPDLDPEQAWVSEVAIEQRFWQGGAVVLTLRHSALTDVIDRSPVFTATSSFDRRANIGDGTKDELVASLALPFERVGFRGALLKVDATWTRSEVTDPTTREKREISGVHPVEWEVHFTHDLPQWKALWGVDGYGGFRETYYRFDRVETRKLEPFIRPFAEWKPTPTLSFRLELPNINEHDFRNTSQVYSGARRPATFLYTDDRNQQFGRMYYFRIRKTWG